MSVRVQRWAAVATLVVGSGLALAPVAFQMFERAPLGGDMIDDFEPYMTRAKIDTFRGYMADIDAAVTEAADLKAATVDQGDVSAAEYDTAYVSVTKLVADWQTIDADMGDLLDRMDNNMGNYRAVAALPSFDLFPWFFVGPGVIVVGLSVAALIKGRRGAHPRGVLLALAAMGLGIVAAPAIFQMFTRAPKGGEMIDSFRPMMTRQRVQNVQGYFVTLGAGEGQLRVGAEQAFVDGGGDLADYTALQTFSAEWPTIVGEFNPMIATMSDNVDNFEAVDAMPSFPLFPWFFVVPGVLVAGLAGAAARRTSPPTSPSEAQPS